MEQLKVGQVYVKHTSDAIELITRKVYNPHDEKYLLNKLTNEKVELYNYYDQTFIVLDRQKFVRFVNMGIYKFTGEYA